jgi:hypothetical protein
MVWIERHHMWTSRLGEEEKSYPGKENASDESFSKRRIM